MNLKTWRNQYRWWILFAVITLLGLAARIYWVVKVPNVPVSDFSGYWEIAKNVYNNLGISQRGEPRAFQGPGYPLLLGMFFKLTGSTSLATAKTLNIMLSEATLLVLFFTLKRIFSRIGIVMLAYAMLTFLPNYIAFNSVLGTEIPFTFFMALTLFFQFSGLDRKWRYPLMGVCIACTSLVRPYFIVYPVIVAAAEWLRHKSWRETAVSGLTTLLVMCAVISPWTIRNYIIFDTFVPVAANGGYVLFVNNNDNNWTGGWMHPDQIVTTEEFRARFREYGVEYYDHPPQTDHIYRDEALRWIANHPWKFFQLGVIRVKNTFFNGAEDIEKWTMNQFREKMVGLSHVDRERLIKFGRAVSDTIIYMLSTFGFIYVLIHLKDMLFSLFRKTTTISFGASIIVMNIAFFAAVYFVTEGQPRYNFPVLVFMVLAAAASLELLWQHRRAASMR